MRRELSIAELESEHTELLPPRETLFFGNTNWASVMASNSSLALNAASLYSAANSAAVQTITVSQG
ncbi:hypothetical protein ASC77_24060 [Nocardioides sp. Root1257]|uniref:hypothetical protein n=1 Tax=unclassified Nocardioides TaxID=2615069 RepID=UPI0006F20631|nr:MULTISPECIES: hypothetical protein [unclassified Nocardioides]KQW52464.1 hypothetical protein ASC77_24060 [Nocardioides sp. Root1257]KRC54527.1 hypothetical protein ASE24_23855 [Nocardioides sp. Root224]